MALPSTADLHDTLHDALENLRGAADTIGDEAQDKISRSTASVINAAQALLKDAKANAAEAAKDVAKEVREHPIATAAAVTAAAAAVIGLLAATQKSKKH